MKYSTVLLALAAGAFAMPQKSDSITSAPAASATLTPQMSCAASCKAGDVTCQAACFGVARPNSSQAIATNECAAKCDQGDGSPSDTAAYAKCQQECFASHFPSSQTLTQGAAGAASTGAAAASSGASATGSGAAARSSGASGTGTAAASGSGSATGSAAQASGSNAAGTYSPQIVGAGLAGLMAVFAL